MHYASLKKTDIANGPGVRVSLFVSGCEHRCPDCFNPEAWEFDYGKPFTQADLNELLAALAPKHIKGLTLLGGEPLHPRNRAEVLHIAREVRKAYPEKPIWCFTGYDLFTELLPENDPELREILSLVDVLVDGRFVKALKDLSLRFRGSSNQRLLDVPASLQTNTPILWEDKHLANPRQNPA